MTLTQEEFFSEGLLMREGIPPGSTFNQTGDTYQLILPPVETFCSDRVTDANRCPTIVIINGTSDVDYRIDGKLEAVRATCTYTYCRSGCDCEILIDCELQVFLELAIKRIP